jgi:hypothetical protein
MVKEMIKSHTETGTMFFLFSCSARVDASSCIVPSVPCLAGPCRSGGGDLVCRTVRKSGSVRVESW